MICNIYIFVSTGLCLDCGVMSVHYDKCTLFYYNLVCKTNRLVCLGLFVYNTKAAEG